MSIGFAYVWFYKGSYVINNLVLKLNKPGFQPRKHERQELLGLIHQSMIHSQNLLLKLDNLGFQPSKEGGQKLPGQILQIVYHS